MKKNFIAVSFERGHMLFGVALAIVWPFFSLASASIGDLLQTAPRQVGDYFGCCSALVRRLFALLPIDNRTLTEAMAKLSRPCLDAVSNQVRTVAEHCMDLSGLERSLTDLNRVIVCSQLSSLILKTGFCFSDIYAIFGLLLMYHLNDHFPILDLQKFQEGIVTDRDLLFHELIGPREISEPHKHDFFILLLFQESVGTHTIDFDRFVLGRNQLHLVFPGQVHKWQMADPTYALQLMISRHWFESLLPALRFPISYYLKHLVLDLSATNFQSLLTEFKAIADDLQDGEVLWELIYARVKVIALLISKIVQDNYDDYEQYQDNPIMAKFVQLIDEWYKSEKSVAFYAEKLNISANYLNVLSNRVLQKSASFLIQERVLLEAKRLLKISDKTIKAIVFDLGFYDNASFSKFFKSHTNMTPSQFKAQP